MIFIKQQNCAAALVEFYKVFPGIPATPSVKPENELQEALQAIGVQTDQDSNGAVWFELLDVDTVNDLRDLAFAFTALLPFLED